MTKLLYISVNSKPTDLSASKTVAVELINRIKEKYNKLEVEEVDLYKEHIPRLEYQYFEKRSCIVDEEKCKQLSKKDQDEISIIRRLCDQFIDADIYVIASPMWSLSFPAPLKSYIDCIIQDQKTISFDDKNKGPQGLLDNKKRVVIYVQSSGAEISWMIKPIMNKGLNYIENIMKIMGIHEFEELLVDGTGYTLEEKQEAIDDAIKKIDHIVDKIKL